MQELARYWRTTTTGASARRELKALPHFITEIDGLDIHFIHVRSKHEDALPLIVTHGWPGSIIEQLKIIDPLTNPTAHGASASDAFHLVIPSMPGYGFSGKPTAHRLGPRAHRARLGRADEAPGIHRYVAPGGDWGAQIVDLMGAQAPPGLLGIHTNMPGAVPSRRRPAAVLSGGPPPSGLIRRGETRVYDKLKDFCATDVAYALEMGTRPQTLYGIADSPVGLAAWMLDHDATQLALIARVFDGQAEGLTRDDVLDNITHYWLTNTGVSSARLYWENKLSFFGPKGVAIPVAVSVFPDELYQAPRSWAEKAYPKLIHYNKLDKGGHFAAWEQPQALRRRGPHRVPVASLDGDAAPSRLLAAGVKTVTHCEVGTEPPSVLPGSAKGGAKRCPGFSPWASPLLGSDQDSPARRPSRPQRWSRALQPVLKRVLRPQL